MDGTDSDRDPWMFKITRALQGFRQASRREAEEMEAQRLVAERDERAAPRGEPA
jgi:hypothetical protein